MSCSMLGPAFIEELQLRNATGHTLQPSRIKSEHVHVEGRVRERTVVEKGGKDKDKCVIE